MYKNRQRGSEIMPCKTLFQRDSQMSFTFTVYSHNMAARGPWKSENSLSLQMGQC